MIRGTTPTLRFTLPFGTEMIADAWVTFAQYNRVILDKHLSDCQCDGNDLIVKLTQEDTLKFCTERNVEIQIRIKDPAGNSIASNIMKEDVGRILKDGVI